MNIFVEAEHPRDKYGKFTTKQLKDLCKIDYGKFVKTGETTELIPEIKKGEYKGKDNYPRNTSHYKFENGKKPENLKTIDEIYGEEYKGYKGQGAIDKVLHEKSGHVKNAFYKPEVGNIDIIWGNDRIGLKHLIKEREEEKKGHSIIVLSTLAKVLENSIFRKTNAKGNFEYTYKENGVTYFVVIAPSYHGQKATYVITGFNRYKNKKRPS